VCANHAQHFHADDMSLRSHFHNSFLQELISWLTIHLFAAQVPLVLRMQVALMPPPQQVQVSQQIGLQEPCCTPAQAASLATLGQQKSP
jgi:hypothetical protein